MKTTLVAELGCTHLGNLAMAEDMVRACQEADFAEVKGQLRTLKDSWKSLPRTGGYGKTFYEHQSRIELSRDDHLILKQLSIELDMDYYVSIWDEQSAKWAADNFSIVKIAAPLCGCRELYDWALAANPEVEFYVSVHPLLDTKRWLKLTQDLRISRVYSCVPLYPTPLPARPCAMSRMLLEGVQATRDYHVETGLSLHVAYPMLLEVIGAAVLQGVGFIEFHVTPYNAQRQKGAQMAVPLHEFDCVSDLVRQFEVIAAAQDPEHDVPYRKEIEATLAGLRAQLT